MPDPDALRPDPKATPPAPAKPAAPKAQSYALDDEEVDDGIDDAPAAAAPETPAKAEKKVYTHPASIVRQARALGLSDAVIAATPPDTLDTRVDAMLEQQALTAAKAKPPEPEEEEDEDDDVELSLGDDVEKELDPAFLKAHKEGTKKLVKALAAKDKKKIKELEARLEQQATAERNREVAKVVRQYDAGFAALASPLLGGDAPGAKLAADSAEMKRRKLVVASLEVAPGEDVADAVARTAKELFGLTDPETPAKKKAAVDAWNQGAVAKPTARKAELPPGEAKARRTAAAKLREMDASDDGEDDEDLI